MVVKNVKVTSTPVCGCGNWLTHWRKFGRPTTSFAQRQTCSVTVCHNPMKVGAHVQKEVLEGMHLPGLVGDSSWYILPLCAACSREVGGTLTVDDECGLAPADVGQTCGRTHSGDPGSKSF
jgi:hypothetical protein